MILVADDDPMIRSLIEVVVQSAGYDPLLASDGEEALDIFKQNIGKVKLFLSDVAMPKMSGPQAFVEMRMLDPKLKQIFISGYGRNAVSFDGNGNLGFNFLDKPVKVHELVQKIREVLDKK